MNPILEPVSHEEASDFIKNKPAVTREIFDKLLPELKARAFTVTRIEDANVLQDLRGIIAELPQGGDWNKLKEQVVDKLQATNEWFSDERAAKRAELLLRTHGFQAYAASAWQDLQADTETFPYWRYMSMGDEAVRAAHVALDGIVLPANHPFWQTHYPPWDWGCRCQVIPVDREEYERIQAEDAKKDPAQRSIIEGKRLDKLMKEGTIDRGPNMQIDVRSPVEKFAEQQVNGKNPPPPYRWNPGDLRIPLESLKAHYADDPSVWSHFVESAQATKLEDGKSLWAWLGGKVKKPFVKKIETPENARKVIARLKDQYSTATESVQASKYQYLTQRTQNNATAVNHAIKQRSDIMAKAVKAVEQNTSAALTLTYASRFSKAEKALIHSHIDQFAKLAGVSMDGKTVVVKACRGNRAYCSGNTIHISKSYLNKGTTVHECGHVLEHSDPAYYEKAKAFLERRTSGEEVKSLRELTGNNGYRYSEKAKKDKFLHPYMGKLYNSATEIVSMGLELMATNPIKLATEDADMFDFIYNLVRNK